MSSISRKAVFVLAPIIGLTTMSHSQSFAAEDKSDAKAAVADTPGQQTAHTMQHSTKDALKYLLYIPKDYAKKESWPLMLFLHGAGERGDVLELVKKHGPPKLITKGQDMPFVVVSPQCPGSHWWEPVALSALLDEVVETHKIDKDRVYVTGLSMGGFGTWSLAAQTPKRFAAIMPICGGGTPDTAKLLTNLPIWVFHGGKDPVVPLTRSEAMVEALKKAGGNVKFTVYPDAGHDAWTETYNNPKVYEWLLAQKRK